MSVPPDANITFVGAPVTGRTGSISGRVTGLNGEALAGVYVVTNLGGIGLTDAGGNYTISNVPLGAQVVFPVLMGQEFTPAALTVNLTAQQAAVTGQNFALQGAGTTLFLPALWRGG